MATSFRVQMCSLIRIRDETFGSLAHLLEGTAPSGVPGAYSAGGPADAALLPSPLAASVGACVLRISPLQFLPPRTRRHGGVT